MYKIDQVTKKFWIVWKLALIMKKKSWKSMESWEKNNKNEFHGKLTYNMKNIDKNHRKLFKDHEKCWKSIENLAKIWQKSLKIIRNYSKIHQNP